MTAGMNGWIVMDKEFLNESGNLGLPLSAVRRRECHRETLCGRQGEEGVDLAFSGVWKVVSHSVRGTETSP
jgi:hypothetical protein